MSDREESQNQIDGNSNIIGNENAIVNGIVIVNNAVYVELASPSDSLAIGSPSSASEHNPLQGALLLRPPTSSRANKIAFADTLENEIKARSIADWCSLGLTRSEAKNLWTNGVGAVSDQNLFPTFEEPVKLITAEMGSGKTLTGRRLLQIFLSQFRERTESSPVPCYLKTRPQAEQLEQVIKNAVGHVARLEEQGIVVVIDDNYQPESGSAYQLWKDAQLLVGSYPQTFVVILSRPLENAQLSGKETQLQPLPEPEAVSLIQRLGGDLRFDRLADLPPLLREAALRPLFAILIAQAFRPDVQRRAPQSRADLMADLVNRVLESQGRDVEDQLVLLACRILERGGPIPINELDETVFSKELIAKLFRTGFVTQEHRALSFNLHVVASWFGALSLKQGAPPPERFSDYELRVRWFDSLTMFISQNAHDRVFPYMDAIVKAAPGEATFLIEESMRTSERRALGDSLHVPPPWNESGRRIYETMSAWSESLGPLTRLLIPTRPDGLPTRLGVCVNGGVLCISWQGVTDDKILEGNSPSQTNVIALPEEFGSTARILNSSSRVTGNWTSIRWTHVAQYSSWAWEITSDQLRGSLRNVIKNKALPLEDGSKRNIPLGRELGWAGLLALLRLGSLYHDPIPVNRIVESLSKAALHGTTCVSRPGGKTYPIALIIRECERLQNEGKTEWLPPYSGPDDYSENGWERDPTTGEKFRPEPYIHVGSNWYENYTEEGLAKQAGEIWGAALAGYESMVEIWFPKLSPYLTTFATRPLRLVGRVEHPWKEKLWAPHMKWHFEALPDGSTTEIDVRPEQAGEKEYMWSEELQDLLRTKRNTFRPSHVQVLPVSVFSQIMSLSDTPATDLAYEWLKGDLEKINWL